jgi:hypothetical protein
MKKYSRRLAILSVGLILALAGAALTHSIAVQSSQAVIDTTTAFFLQATSTPQPADESEIGSTDGIVVMGVIIVLIVALPILIRRKHWRRQSPG